MKSISLFILCTCLLGCLRLRPVWSWAETSITGSSSSFVLSRSIFRNPTVWKNHFQCNNYQRYSIQMHMGHSHSHHEHLYQDDATTSHQHQQQPRRFLFRRRRLVAMIVFLAGAILGPPIFISKRSLGRSDVTIFGVAVTAVTAAEPLRNSILQFLQRLRALQQGIANHSAPITASYIFANKNAADRVTILGGFMNIVLSVAKLGIGITCHSTALIADAGHSLSDLFSDVVTLWAVHVARLPPDHDHPQGHGKFEAIGALFLSLTLIVTSLTIGMASNTKLLELLALTRSNNLASFDYIAPSLPALFMAVLSIVSKEWLFRITRKVGQQLQSTVVIANAWHHRSDAYSSVLAAGSIGLAMYVPGFIFADAAAGLFVAAMIGMTGMEILGESVQQLTDTATIVAVDGKSDSNAGAIDVRSIPTENVINGLIQTASLANEEGALPALSLQEAGAAQSQWPMPKIEETSRGPAEHPASSATTIVEAHVLKEILRFGHNDVVVCRVDARETESDVGGRFNSATGSNARRWTTDVTIRFPKEKKVETTISMAFEKAKDIRHSLENSSVLAIDNVRVYLDLNGE